MDRNQVKAKKNLFSHLYGDIRSDSVVRTMQRVPRERFVPLEKRHMAYLDLPLSIGEGHTISQPYIVAMMTEAMELRGGEKVLEVGTGSGYQTAILSALVPRGWVVSVEVVPSLAERARNLLHELGYDNIEVISVDDTLGCPELGPYNATMVTAAAPRLPESLVSQLAAGGRLVVPWGHWSSRNWCRPTARMKACLFACWAPAGSFP